MVGINSKKAQGHIEVVISFSIFMVFLLFLLVIFNPLKKPVNPEVVDVVFTNLEENLNSELQKASIIVSEDVGSDAAGFFYINPDNIDGLDLCDNGENMVIQKGDSELLYDIYCAKDLIKNVDNSLPVLNRVDDINNIGEGDSGKYQVLYVGSETAWFEDKIRIFKQEYCYKYDDIKDDYIFVANDFAVIIIGENENIEYKLVRSDDSDDNCNDPPPVPTGIDVFVRDYPVKTFYNNDDGGVDVSQRRVKVIVW